MVLQELCNYCKSTFWNSIGSTKSYNCLRGSAPNIIITSVMQRENYFTLLTVHLKVMKKRRNQFQLMSFSYRVQMTKNSGFRIVLNRKVWAVIRWKLSGFLMTRQQLACTVYFWLKCWPLGSCADLLATWLSSYSSTSIYNRRISLGASFSQFLCRYDNLQYCVHCTTFQ